MIAVITGDIINSKRGDIENWISPLKETLDKYGKEPTNWEIFRGDSFQLSLDIKKAILAALHIKATIKLTKLHDVRMAIGIGEEKYTAAKITEANGSAYINSGECFESLKKQTLAIKSNDKKLNQTLNIMLNLSLLTTNNWTTTVAEVIKIAIENPEKTQKELAKQMNKSQSTVSEALKRGGFEEIMAMNKFYEKIISKL